MNRCQLCNKLYRLDKYSDAELCDECCDAIAELEPEEEVPCRS